MARIGIRSEGPQLVRLAGGGCGRKSRGFSLIELVIVLLISGLLFGVGAVRLLSFKGFELRLAADQLRTDLAKAQLLALANSVRVRLVTTDAGYRMERTPCSSSDPGPCLLVNPATAQAFEVNVTAEKGIVVTASNQEVFFNLWGIPVDSNGFVQGAPAVSYTLRRQDNAADAVRVDIAPLTGLAQIN